MNAPEDALAEVLAEILAEHVYVPSLARGVSRCTCEIPFHGMPHEHRAHVAQVLAEWVAGEMSRAEKAEALVEAGLREVTEWQDAIRCPIVPEHNDGRECDEPLCASLRDLRDALEGAS